MSGNKDNRGMKGAHSMNALARFRVGLGLHVCNPGDTFVISTPAAVPLLLSLDIRGYLPTLST